MILNLRCDDVVMLNIDKLLCLLGRSAPNRRIMYRGDVTVLEGNGKVVAIVPYTKRRYQIKLYHIIIVLFGTLLFLVLFLSFKGMFNQSTDMPFYELIVEPYDFDLYPYGYVVSKSNSNMFSISYYDEEHIILDTLYFPFSRYKKLLKLLSLKNLSERVLYDTAGKPILWKTSGIAVKKNEEDEEYIYYLRPKNENKIQKELESLCSITP